MTKTQALQAFWSSFELDAYPANAVPEEVILPYLTYTKGSSPDGYSSTVHVYYHTDSELLPDKKTEEICRALRHGGVQIPCDGGSLWLALESPEWYAAEDQTDRQMKHRIINVSIADHTY